MSPKPETTIVFPAEAPSDGPSADGGGSLPRPSGTGTASPRRGRARRSADWARLGMAVVLGLVTWMVIDFTRMQEVVRTVTLSVTVPSGWSLTPPPPTAVQVRLRGTRTAMQNVQRSFLRLDVSIPEGDPALAAADGDGHLQLALALARRGRLQGVPESVELVWTDPETLSLTLERNEVRQFDVEVVLADGKPADGFEVGQVTADPARVAVSGPRKEMERLGLLAMQGRRIQTHPVDITGRSRSESRPGVLLRAPTTESGVELSLERKSVYVTVEVNESDVVRVMDNVPVRVLMSSTEALRDVEAGRLTSWLSPATVRVTVKGQRILVNALRPEKDILVFVTPDSLVPDPESPGTFMARPQWMHSALGQIERVEPSMIRWRYAYTESATGAATGAEETPPTTAP